VIPPRCKILSGFRTTDAAGSIRYVMFNKFQTLINVETSERVIF